MLKVAMEGFNIVWFPSISTTHFVVRSFSGEMNIEHFKTGTKYDCLLTITPPTTSAAHCMRSKVTNFHSSQEHDSEMSTTGADQV